MSENAEFVDRFYKEGRAALVSVTTTSCRRSTSAAPGQLPLLRDEYVEGKTLYDLMHAAAVVKAKLQRTGSARHQIQSRGVAHAIVAG
jgi:hypothetical protein